MEALYSLWIYWSQISFTIIEEEFFNNFSYILYLINRYCPFYKISSNSNSNNLFGFPKVLYLKSSLESTFYLFNSLLVPTS